MSKNNENKLVPRLRFPEFTNENWNRKTIDETCEILNNLRKPLTTNLREKGIYPYYGASGIIDYVKDYIFNERLLLIGEDGAKWLAYEKTAFIAEGKYWVNNHAHVLKPIGVVDTLLENYLVKLDISPFITGAAPPKLTLGKLKSIPVPIPENQKEQQKIAACLSSLDDVINAESKKLEVLKEHKKGLLQNLFPQEGETVPKLRFKEFEDSGEWVERTLGEVSDNVMYGMNSAAIMFDGENKYIRITDIDDNTRLFSPNPLTSPDGQLDDKYFVNVGDILFARTGASVGKSYLHQKENGKIYFAGFLIRFTIKNANPYFIYLQTLTEKYQKWVSKTSLRSGQPGINAEEFKSYPILISSLPEQQRIASCLSSLDNLINAQSQKIETLKLHKKGLLQGLFPDINEHNG